MALLKDIELAVKGLVGRIDRDRPGLSTFLFHAVFADGEEARSAPLAPQQGITVRHLRAFVGHYLGAGYRFVGPEEVAGGMPGDARWAMITFDDGYANNLRALPVLEEMGVPGVFFVSTGHVREGKAFWWDALHRGRRAAGIGRKEIRSEAARLRGRPWREIEAWLRRELGDAALRPVGEVDRPMTPEELRRLAAHRWVRLGNHTSQHAILTGCGDQEARDLIAECQRDLREAGGREPIAISYPGGAYDQRVLALSAAMGFEVGITVERRKNRPPLDDRRARLALGRFTLWGQRHIGAQCRVFRSDLYARPLAAAGSGRGAGSGSGSEMS